MTTSITKPEKMAEGDFANYFCTYGALATPLPTRAADDDHLPSAPPAAR